MRGFVVIDIDLEDGDLPDILEPAQIGLVGNAVRIITVDIDQSAGFIKRRYNF